MIYEFVEKFKTSPQLRAITFVLIEISIWIGGALGIVALVYIFGCIQNYLAYLYPTFEPFLVHDKYVFGGGILLLLITILAIMLLLVILAGLTGLYDKHLRIQKLKVKTQNYSEVSTYDYE